MEATSHVAATKQLIDANPVPGSLRNHLKLFVTMRSPDENINTWFSY